jgi:hypothetical protein
MKPTPQFRGPSLILLATVHILLFAAGELRCVSNAPIEMENIGGYDADALFVKIGADASTSWLPSELKRDPRGYICTRRAKPNGRAREQLLPVRFCCAFWNFRCHTVSRLRYMGVRTAGANIALLGGLTATNALLLSGVVGWVLSVPEVSVSAPVVKAIDFRNFLLGGVVYAVGFGLLAAGASATSYFMRLLPRWLVALEMLVALRGNSPQSA